MTSKAISTLVFGGVIVAFFGIALAFCHGAGPDYLERYTDIAPEDASFVVAIAPPQQLIEQFGFDVTDNERAQLAIALGADLLDAQTWRRFGLNPIDPVGLIGWGIGRDRVVALGAHGRAADGRDELAAWLGGARAFNVRLDQVEGMPALSVEGEFVVVYTRRRVLVAFGTVDTAEARIAEILGDSTKFSTHTGRRTAGDFSSRPLVSALVRPAGFASTPQEVVTFNRSPAHELGLIGFALSAQPDGMTLESRSFAGVESEALAALRSEVRTNRGLGSAPGPAEAVLGGSIAPELFYRLAEQAAQLTVPGAQRFSATAETFGTLTGTSASDALGMLTGEFGLAALSLPLFGDEYEAVAFVGLRDPMAIIGMASALNDANAGGERREIGGVTIYSTGLTAAPAACIRDGFAWFATSEELLASVVRGEYESIRSASPNAYALLRDASPGSFFLDLTMRPFGSPFIDAADSLSVEATLTRDTLVTTARLAGSLNEWRLLLVTQLFAEHGVLRELSAGPSDMHDNEDDISEGSGQH